MGQQFTEQQLHQADAAQADAELRRMEMQIRKNEAKKLLDDEFGFSSKREEFKRRLNELRQSSDFKDQMDRYRNDWEGFKADLRERYQKAGKEGDSAFDLLEARIAGLNARIEYYIDTSTQKNLAELKSVRDELMSLSQDVEQNLNSIDDDFDQKLNEFDHKLQKFASRVNEIVKSALH